MSAVPADRWSGQFFREGPGRRQAAGSRPEADTRRPAASSWVSSISGLEGWRQPSSSVNHKPELIANQSNKVQLISKPISNFSFSSCLRFRGKRGWKCL